MYCEMINHCSEFTEHPSSLIDTKKKKKKRKKEKEKGLFFHVMGTLRLFLS